MGIFGKLKHNKEHKAAKLEAMKVTRKRFERSSNEYRALTAEIIILGREIEEAG
jgi:hypothetical protein